MTYLNGKEILFGPQMIKIEEGQNGLKYASGTVEFVDANNFVFYHNLGKIPRFLFLWTEIPKERSNACLGITYSSVMQINSVTIFEDRITYTEPSHLSNYPLCVPELAETYARVTGRSGIYQLLTGVTYNWLVIE